MKQKQESFLLLSAVADIMLYRVIRIPTAQSGLLVFIPAAFLLCLFCGMLCRYALPAGQNPLYSFMLWGYMLVSCLQMHWLFEKIWPNPGGQAFLPLLLLAWAMLLPADGAHSLKISARILWAGALICLAVFLAAAAPNMSIKYLAVQNGEEMRTNAAAAWLSLLMPLPEYIMLTDHSLRPLGRRAYLLPLFVCAVQLALTVIMEATFGPNAAYLELGGYEAAQIGRLFSLKRVDTLQTVFWLCLLIWRVSFLFRLAVHKNDKRRPAIPLPGKAALLAGVYAVAAVRPQLRMILLFGFEILVLAVGIIAMAGGIGYWQRVKKQN